MVCPIPLSKIRGYRSVRIGGLILCWISYSSDGVALSRRLLLTFAPESFGAFEAVIDRIDQAPDRVSAWDLMGAVVLLSVEGILAVAGVLLVSLKIVSLLIRGFLAVNVGVFAIMCLVFGIAQVSANTAD